VTRVGKFIRKYSIDEFPQFLNILIGEMSLVGPRAYYPYELEEQQKNYPQSQKYVKVILSGKPGLTGVWQVTGRSEINFDKRVKMDAGYVIKKSICYDFLLMLKTIPAVITGRGAV
jgi:lipopolysaccharide/colanic/teichoic acid biosynthesis glycosyltransferase